MKTLLFGVMLLFAGAATGAVKVVTTTSDLGAIAREVGGPDVTVQVLAAATQDPHFVDAKPSFVLHVARAELLLLNGLDLEVGWLPSLINASRNPKVYPGARGYFDGSTVVALKEVPTAKLDRSMGDIHPGGNPHYLKDPNNGVAVAEALALRLAEIDPAHAEGYIARARAFAAEASKRMDAWRELLLPHRGTAVVPYHKSWVYFSAFAGLTEVAYVEPKPGVPPGTAHVARTLQLMKQRKVPLLLQEQYYPSGTTELLARASGAQLVRVPGLVPEGQRYLDYIDGLVRSVVEALRRPL